MSRYQLQWYELTKKPGADWFVKVPLCDVYSPIINAAFPDLKHIGWRKTTKSACYTYLKNATEGPVEKLRSLLDLLKSTWVLRLNKTIEKHPFIGEVLQKYDIACATCGVGICLVNDVVSIHALGDEIEAKIEQEIIDYLNNTGE